MSPDIPIQVEVADTTLPIDQVVDLEMFSF
jgi:hypothetical protein